MKKPFFCRRFTFCSLAIVLAAAALIGCKTNFSRSSSSALQETRPYAALGQDPNAFQGSGKHIALLLPASGPHAAAAKTIRDGFLAAYYQHTQHNPAEIAVKIYDTTQGVSGAYQRAIQENAQFIVGPLTKAEVQAIARLRLAVPVLALNTIAENRSLPENLYQFGLLPEDEVIAAAKHAQDKGYRRALLLAPQSEWGQRLAHTFRRFWEANQGQIVDARFFKSNQEIEETLRVLLQAQNQSRRQDVDMIFIAASNEAARQIKPLLNFHHAENLPVYATASVYTGTPMPDKDQVLDGVRFCDMPWILQSSSQIQDLRQVLEKNWPNSTRPSPRFFALGMDAYTLAHQLSNTRWLGASDVAGFSGDLHINNYHHIQRGLVCAKFENGIPTAD